jgi:hypothetical protein
VPGHNRHRNKRGHADPPAPREPPAIS